LEHVSLGEGIHRLSATSKNPLAKP
jgi:hypothetical protein